MTQTSFTQLNLLKYGNFSKTSLSTDIYPYIYIFLVYLTIFWTSSLVYPFSSLLSELPFNLPFLFSLDIFPWQSSDLTRLHPEISEPLHRRHLDENNFEDVGQEKSRHKSEKRAVSTPPINSLVAGVMIGVMQQDVLSGGLVGTQTRLLL